MIQYRISGKRSPRQRDGSLICGYLFDWNDGKADQVRSRLAANFTGWKKDNDKFEEQFERVVKALRSDKGAREKPPRRKLWQQIGVNLRR